MNNNITNFIKNITINNIYNGYFPKEHKKNHIQGIATIYKITGNKGRYILLYVGTNNELPKVYLKYNEGNIKNGISNNYYGGLNGDVLNPTIDDINYYMNKIWQ